MKVKRLHLQNYGRFEDLKIDFAPTSEKTGNVTVIVGNNGAGKSQVLQALATSLSWFIIRLKEDNGEGQHLTQPVIKNNSNRVIVDIQIEDSGVIRDKGSWKQSNMLASWNIRALKEKELQPALHDFQINGLHHLIDSYRYLVKKDEKASLPLLAYYSTERNVVVEPINLDYNFAVNQTIAYKNALEARTDYKLFFQWFRNNEDIENEKSSNKAVISKEREELIKSQMRLENLLLQKEHFEEIDYYPNDEIKYAELSRLSAEIEKAENNYNSLKFMGHFLAEAIKQEKFTSLNSVRHAIEYFTDFKNPRIRRQGTPTMIVEKDGEELDVNQLSQGEKSLLALVGDIARRLALLNPSLDNPLEGEGVVMIDEVDLHLHPKWQHDLIDKLVATFPNIQFILTTHSPHVISDRSDILVYALDDGELTQVPNVYGEDVNTVLTKVFDVDIRDSKVEEQFTVIRRAISKHDYVTAETRITELAEKLPSDHLELLKCRLLLAQAKLAKSNKDESHHAKD